MKQLLVYVFGTFLCWPAAKLAVLGIKLTGDFWPARVAATVNYPWLWIAERIAAKGKP